MLWKVSLNTTKNNVRHRNLFGKAGGRRKRNRRIAKIRKTNVNKQRQIVAWYCVPGTVDVLFCIIPKGAQRGAGHY